MGPELGFGFYRQILDETHHRFARQCGATHAVVHPAADFQDLPNGEFHACVHRGRRTHAACQKKPGRNGQGGDVASPGSSPFILTGPSV